MSVRPLRRLALSLTKYSIFGGGNSLRASFSSTSYCARLIRRSPTVKDLEWRRKAQLNQQPEPQATEEDYSYLWPVEIFDAAYKSGALSVPSWQAVQILNNFEALGPRPRKEAVKQLCSRFGIQPLTLTLLAHILFRSGTKENKIHVTPLFVAASELFDNAATLHLISQAIKTFNLRHPDIKHAREHLRELASSNNSAALILLGKVYETEKQHLKALELYEKVTTINDDTYTGGEALDSRIAEAWENIARIKLDLGDEDGAKEAIEKGAFEYDDPQAYYLLAKNFRPLTSPDYLPFMLKAAVSGVAEATDQLGMYYLRQAMGNLPQNPESSEPAKAESTSPAPNPNPTPTPIAKHHSPKIPSPAFPLTSPLTLSTSWFHIGAENLIPRSQIYLALLLREEGCHAQGLAWLEKAAEAPKWALAVPWFQKRWLYKNWKLADLDMDAIRRGEADGEFL